MPTPSLVTLDELDALVGPAPAELAPWVVQACALADVPALDDQVIADLAAEHDPAGPVASIAGALAAMRIRHRGDRVTQALLAAIEHRHLPDVLDETASRKR